MESSEMIISCLDKKDRRMVEERRRRYVAKEMVRRFSGTLEGRKMHMRSMALILCNMITAETS